VKRTAKVRSIISESIAIDPHGGRGKQGEGMTWKQIKVEAMRIVDEVAQRDRTWS
jgi:hypothetical protein